MKIKIFLNFLCSFLLMLLLSAVGGYLGLDYSVFIGFAAYFFLTLLCLKRYKESLSAWQILLTLLIGLWIIHAPMRIIDFEETLISLPILIFHTLGMICGFLYWRLKKPFNILTAILGCLITVFMFFKGYDYWLHKLNYGTFTGQVEASALPAKFEAFDEQRNLIASENLTGKIVLFDFWFTRCVACFEKFPQVQAAFEKYKNDSSVAIFAVDKPIEEDKPNEAFEMIKEEGYSFPVVIAKDSELPEKLGVKGYPTTFVIDRNGMIVYRGDIAGAVKMIDEIKR